MEELHSYLGGSKRFTVMTNHNALVGLMAIDCTRLHPIPSRPTSEGFLLRSDDLSPSRTHKRI
ncbi:hypothetical protein RvY_06111 [Ramazzottius varieornatus]|uniref:Uncharacterized protein n=1 Tax=Ramazzottius varieornatus TaxID=947166 RepID=A0A1D1UXF9_RAMVA|nr:hypothetical protein RvY_06111 [Ramazzottius varieornatus]